MFCVDCAHTHTHTHLLTFSEIDKDKHILDILNETNIFSKKHHHKYITIPYKLFS
jgi:hypothetical protein